MLKKRVVKKRVRKKRSTSRPRLRSEDLLSLPKEKLAQLLAAQIAGLPYSQWKQWVRRHMPKNVAAERATSSKAASLIDEIEEFCEHSRSGAFVVWVDEGGWYDLDGLDTEAEEVEEWARLFTNLTKGAMELTRLGHHDTAVAAYRMLFDLLREAGDTTDILGNYGEPDEAISLDFGKVIEAYTRSFVGTGSGRNVDGCLNEMLPLAKRYSYRGAYSGLARALDAEGRGRLQARLSRTVDAAGKKDRRSCPEEVKGLLALATVGGNQREVLAIKERFSGRNANYLEEVLATHQKRKNWSDVVRLADLGIRSFGHRGDVAKALMKAHEALKDHSKAQEVHIELFLEEPNAAEWKALKKRSERQSNWSVVYRTLLESSPQRRGWAADSLRTQLLLAEGKERELLEAIASGKTRMDFETIKLVAKYAVARVSEGADLRRFKKLRKLETRLKRERDEPYEWLRLFVENPSGLDRSEYTDLAADMYRRLVDQHLDSGKSSRATPAAHYCAIVYELSLLLEQPTLWSDLLEHLRRAHGRKRIIWKRLAEEGCSIP